AKEEGWGINPVMKRHLELDLKRLFKNAPRDPDKLERLLEIKQRQKEEAMDEKSRRQHFEPTCPLEHGIRISSKR
ncbi:MAG: hypothetical protein M3M86_02870, partial [Thermoproteota archaeon]|nr:hypothetical protein [Thermoproteota archaeon]